MSYLFPAIIISAIIGIVDVMLFGVYGLLLTVPLAIVVGWAAGEMENAKERIERDY